MKKMTFLLVIIGLILSNNAFAPELSKWNFGLTYKKVETFDISKICLIESNNTDYSTSSEGAIGRMQITKPVLTEWNNHHPEEKHVLNDLKKKQVNIKIGTWYLTERIPVLLKSANLDRTEVNCLMTYNWGIKNLKNWYKSGQNYSLIPTETKNYIIKYYQGKIIQ